MRHALRSIFLSVLVLLVAAPASAQEARRRWEQMCQIRKDKFDYILPQAMRENGIDMWLVMMKEGHYDPLYDDLGRGYPGRVGFYIFTDRGTGGRAPERTTPASSAPRSAWTATCSKPAAPTTSWVATST